MKDEEIWKVEPDLSDKNGKHVNYAEIIYLIIKYYNLNHTGDSLWEGEEWKRSLQSPRQIPEDLDDVVKRSFIHQIKKAVGPDF